MKERIDHPSAESSTLFLDAKSVGAAIVNLVGSGISLGSIIYFIENVGDKPVESSMVGAGGLLAGSVVISTADSIKKMIWKENSEKSNPTV